MTHLSAPSSFAPSDRRPAGFERLDGATLDRLRALRGVTPTASDVLDELGYAMAVAGSVLVPRVPVAQPVVGQAITLRYLPERMTVGHGRGTAPQRLAHFAAFELASPTDVVVIDAGGAEVSTMGGLAALAARRAGLGGCIVDGGVRDVDDMLAIGLPVWSRHVTPVTGKWRLEAAQINAPVHCAGVQVHAGDLVLADRTGVCFVPRAAAATVTERVLEIAAAEGAAFDDPSLPLPEDSP